MYISADLLCPVVYDVSLARTSTAWLGGRTKDSASRGLFLSASGHPLTNYRYGLWWGQCRKLSNFEGRFISCNSTRTISSLNNSKSPRCVDVQGTVHRRAAHSRYHCISIRGSRNVNQSFRRSRSPRARAHSEEVGLVLHSDMWIYGSMLLCGFWMCFCRLFIRSPVISVECRVKVTSGRGWEFPSTYKTIRVSGHR